MVAVRWEDKVARGGQKVSCPVVAEVKILDFGGVKCDRLGMSPLAYGTFTLFPPEVRESRDRRGQWPQVDSHGIGTVLFDCLRLASLPPSPTCSASQYIAQTRYDLPRILGLPFGEDVDDYPHMVTSAIQRRIDEEIAKVLRELFTASVREPPCDRDFAAVAVRARTYERTAGCREAQQADNWDPSPFPIDLPPRLTAIYRLLHSAADELQTISGGVGGLDEFIEDHWLAALARAAWQASPRRDGQKFLRGLLCRLSHLISVQARPSLPSFYIPVSVSPQRMRRGAGVHRFAADQCRQLGVPVVTQGKGIGRRFLWRRPYVKYGGPLQEELMKGMRDMGGRAPIVSNVHETIDLYGPGRDVQDALRGVHGQPQAAIAVRGRRVGRGQVLFAEDGGVPSRVGRRQRLGIIRQLLEAVAFLHQNGVIYRDMKRHNIMYDAKTDAAVLIDLGSAAVLGEGKSLIDTSGGSAVTPQYQPPELPHSSWRHLQPDVPPDGLMNMASDIWMVAKTAVEIVTGHFVKGGDTDGRGEAIDALPTIPATSSPLPSPGRRSHRCLHFIFRCLIAYNPCTVEQQRIRTTCNVMPPLDTSAGGGLVAKTPTTGCLGRLPTVISPIHFELFAVQFHHPDRDQDGHRGGILLFFCELQLSYKRTAAAEAAMSSRNPMILPSSLHPAQGRRAADNAEDRDGEPFWHPSHGTAAELAGTVPADPRGGPAVLQGLYPGPLAGLVRAAWQAPDHWGGRRYIWGLLEHLSRLISLQRAAADVCRGLGVPVVRDEGNAAVLGRHRPHD
ncbi:unnamed protein product [Vitrella brassicaformis CCMP3155]|uniref:Protein kinase domain-containing protein n=1 Tax=Vitrella brassicaformis (strain CCMP3155) TaxID=1169540 RepID=A0A0G4FF52_VITBC|nr:unnamed protein product [Vitrella brassicaformis CCMP3155]|eukprot:CEM11698.1 unnamed protein product [Vitrella brassicaformis CCMP3155]